MPKAKDYFLVKSQRYFSLFKFRAKQFLKHTEYRIDPEEAAHAPRPPILQTKSHRTAKLHSGYTQALGKKKTYARNKKKISLPRLETIPILVSTIPMKGKTILILVFLHPYGKCSTPRALSLFHRGTALSTNTQRVADPRNISCRQPVLLVQRFHTHTVMLRDGMQRFSVPHHVDFPF